MAGRRQPNFSTKHSSENFSCDQRMAFFRVISDVIPTSCLRKLQRQQNSKHLSIFRWRKSTAAECCDLLIMLCDLFMWFGQRTDALTIWRDAWQILYICGSIWHDGISSQFDSSSSRAGDKSRMWSPKLQLQLPEWLSTLLVYIIIFHGSIPSPLSRRQGKNLATRRKEHLAWITAYQLWHSPMANHRLHLFDANKQHQQQQSFREVNSMSSSLELPSSSLAITSGQKHEWVRRTLPFGRTRVKF